MVLAIARWRFGHQEVVDGLDQVGYVEPCITGIGDRSVQVYE